ncbi:hypothetical protein C0J52_06540 [Blattella germanica]|nr:hypothetical protein C0J52_06540 [Blattella germanica]
MNQTHLRKDSTCPALQQGKLRLYNMRFCPYGHRVRLVLEAKKIPYDIVYINIRDKPEWYFQINPAGKVPSIETEYGDCVYESLILAEYLDEKYPGKFLNSTDPMQKAKDKMLVEAFSKVIQEMYKMYLNADIEVFEKILNELGGFETEITSRGKVFFGGDSPRMLDYMIWPWIERIGVLKFLGGNEFVLTEHRFPELIAWRQRMQNDEAVAATYLEPELYAKYFDSLKAGKPDFDLCLKYINLTRYYWPALNVDYCYGSSCPPLEEGKLRLYGMNFCPFTQRVRIVLKAKNAPHDIVNINLKNKPDWLSKVHPEGKVPALDTGDKVLVESLDIADFIDEKYPDPPLYPSDPELKSKDKEFIQKFGKVIGATSRAIYNKENLPLDEYMTDILEPLEEFEAELANRGSTFFGGENPGMLDYMMWPWSERSKVPSALQDKEFTFPKEKFPTLVAWREAMKEVEAVKETITPMEIHVKFLKGYFGGDNPEYDNL